MTFLNPLYLLALAAAAIPIILHLLNLRKSRVIEFSTLSFLKELQRSKIRKLKLKQWLLLALRTLIIIFVVLAFTRPALRSGFGFLPGTTAKTSVVIVMDNSFSMMVSDEHGQLLKQARQKALQIVDLMRPGDDAALVLTTAPQQTRAFTAALNAIRGDIEDVTVSYAHGDYAEAMTAASALLAQSGNFNKEVYVITDRQRSQFASAEQSPRALFDGSTRVFILPLGDEQTGNAAVVDAEVRNAIFESGKPVDVRGTIRNASASDMSSSIVSVFLDGERVSQQTVSVQSGGTAQVDFTVLPRRAGWIEGFIELEDDALPEDNRRYFSFHIPEKLNILLGPASGKDAAILQLALNPTQEETDIAKGFNIDAADRGSLLSANLSRYDVVILLGARDLSSAFIQRLASWLRDGGSVMLFPDADGNVDTWSNDLLPALGLPAAQGSTGSLTEGASFITFGAVDFDHPLFANIFASEESDEARQIDSPQLYYTIKLRGNERARQVINTSNGDAFLLDAPVGEGRALVYAVNPSLRWSDFALKGIFVPLLNRSMYYLSAREDNTFQMDMGATAELTVPSSAAGEALFELRGAEGSVQRIVPKSLPSGLVFPITSPDRPGVYTLNSGDNILRSVTVNTDPAESDLAQADAEQERAFFQRLGIEKPMELGVHVDVSQAVAEVRFGVELWKYMIALALLCALIEMLVARDVKRAQLEMEK
ncbi:BatA domain-containing protein [bacterium]|nr:BatA domain-containing protein [bacterium]